MSHLTGMGAFCPKQFWSLWDLMITLQIGPILRGLMVLSALSRKWDAERAARQPFQEHQFVYVRKCIGDLYDALASSGLPISAGLARELGEAFDRAATEPNGDRVLEGESLSYSTHYLGKLGRVDKGIHAVPVM